MEVILIIGEPNFYNKIYTLKCIRNEVRFLKSGF
jgi:hypothetical protein